MRGRKAAPPRSTIADVLEGVAGRRLSAAEKTRAVRLANGIHREVALALRSIFDPSTHPAEARGRIHHLRRTLRILLGVSKERDLGYMIAGIVDVCGEEIRAGGARAAADIVVDALRPVAPLIPNFWRRVRRSGTEPTVLAELERAVRLKACGNSRWLIAAHRAVERLGLHARALSSFKTQYHCFKRRPLGADVG